MSEDNIINLEDRRNPLQHSQAKLLARLKKKHEAKQKPRVQAERLIWAREMFKFSQEDWAEILEVTLETVQDWEEGKSEPNDEQLSWYCMDVFRPSWFYEPVSDTWPGLENTSLRFH